MRAPPNKRVKMVDYNVNKVKQPTVLVRLITLLYFLYHNLIYIGTNKEYTMAKNTSVTLGDHFDQFINQQL